jgi:hypothetical protein
MGRSERGVAGDRKRALHQLTRILVVIHDDHSIRMVRAHGLESNCRPHAFPASQMRVEKCGVAEAHARRSDKAATVVATRIMGSRRVATKFGAIANRS